MLPQQAHILHGGPAGPKAGGGLDKVRARHGHHPAQVPLLLLVKAAGLDNHLQNPALAGGLHRPDLRQQPLPVAGLGQALVHHHVDLVRAIADGVLRLEDLHLRGGVAVGEADHGAYFHGAAHIGGRPLHIPGRNTHGGGSQLPPLVTDRLHLLPGGGGGQQGVLHPAQNFLLIHTWLLSPPVGAGDFQQLILLRRSRRCPVPGCGIFTPYE